MGELGFRIAVIAAGAHLMGVGRSGVTRKRRDGREAAVSSWVYERRAPWSWEITGHHNHAIFKPGALFAMQHNGWDRALKVTATGTGLVGHAGAVLLRKAADQTGLTSQLSAAVRRKGSSPLLDRGLVLVSLAVAIALGAASMSDIPARAPVPGAGGRAERVDGPPGAGPRRDPRMLDRIARARARAREHAWKLIEATAAGFPWLAVAGKTLTGWLVIDMDATLIAAHSDKEGAAPTWKKGYGFHPLGAWCANTRECLHMLLRLGNA